MAGKIKGITITLGADVQPLNKALKDVNKKSRNLQGELRQVGRLLKLDPKNTELLAQKQKLLAEAVENSREKLDRLKTAQEQVNEQFRKGEINEEQYRAFQREVVKAEQELSKFEKQLRETGMTAEQVGKKLQDAGQKMTDAGKSLSTKVTAPIVGLGAVIAKTGMDFEAAMSEVGAISGATGEDLEKLEALAREMGATTKFSASEAASGLKFMGMAGWDTQQMLDGLPGVLSLAAASGEELGTVSDIVTDAMTAFGMEAKRAGEFADTLAAASSSSNTNVGIMGESFKYVAPLAGALGYEAKDTAIALGLMANAGIKGSQSGTAMRSILTRLAKPTKESGTAMDQLGISLTNTDGSMKSLAEIIDDLREAFKDLNPEQQAVYAAQIAGQEAMSGLLAIVNTSEDDFNKLSESINNSTGAAERMADEMQDNLKGRLNELSSAIAEVALQLYEAMLPALEKVVAAIQKLVDWFAKLSPGMKTTIVVIAGIVAAIGPLLIILGLMAQGIGAVVASAGAISGVFAVAGAAIGAITAPIALAVAAVAGLIAIGVALYKNWDEIKEKATEIWSALVQTFESIKTEVSAIVSEAVSWGENIVQGIIDGITGVVGRVVEAASNLANNISSTIKRVLGIASPSKVMAEFGRYVAEGLAQGIKESTNKVAQEAQRLAQAISGAVQIMTGELSNALSLSNARFELQKELLGDNADEVQKLTLELQRLIAEKENLAAKVDVLSAAYEMSKKKLGENNETTKQYAYELEKAQIELQKMEVSIRKTSVAIEEQKKKAIEAARQQAQELRNLADEVTNVEKKYREDLVAAHEEYQRRVAKVNDKLIEDERRVQAEYEKTLDDRARALRDFVGLFDEVTSKDVSGEQLLKNLRGQVDAFENWQENIADLAAKGVDEGLIDELRQMGPKAGPEIAALNTLTDKQLQEYVALWRTKNQKARQEAVNQLQQQREEMQQKLIEIRIAAQEQLEAYRVEWEKKNAEIRKNAEEEMKRIEQRFKEISEAGSKYGISLMTNFIGGIESRFEQLRQTLENMAAMVDSYMPHSPAKRGPLSRIMEWGPALVDSLVDGIRRSLPKLESIMENMANIPTARAIPIAGGSSTTNNYNNGGNTIHITVQDGEDLLRTLHRLGVRLP